MTKSPDIPDTEDQPTLTFTTAFTLNEMAAIFSALINTEWSDEHFTDETIIASGTAMEKTLKYFRRVGLQIEVMAKG
jgi:hypothetical protein